MTNFGWTYDPERIAAATERIESAGFKFSFSADRPSMKGYWKSQQNRGKTKILAQDDEKALNGSWRDPNMQYRGTCVGQGSSRAIEDVHISRLVDGVVVGKYTQIAYEVMYGYERHERWSRTQPWGTQGECNDGLNGSDAAAFYTTKGVLARGVYQSIDLSKPCEQKAIEWNNSGVPDVLVAACNFHKIVCHISSTWDDFADAIASKCWGHICLPKLFGFQRIIHDKDGCMISDWDGGHCTEVCGLVTLPNHETGFVIQQSWGLGPKYPTQVQTVDGPLALRPGSYVLRQSTLESCGNQVERISCDIPSGSSFR